MSRSQVIPGIAAWNAVIHTQNCRWSDDIDRFQRDLVTIVHRPKFSIAPTDAFFCIGSCFARNVEEHLIYAGRRVLSKRLVFPVEDGMTRINGCVNKFTTHSITNELEWVTERPLIDETLFDEGPQGWRDLQLAPEVRPASLRHAIERRVYLVDDYFSRIRQAQIVILTLGLNEVWRDAQSSRYLNATPSLASVRKEPDRYSVRITDVGENVDQLEKIQAILYAINPALRSIVTVSPVPMSETFSGKDIIAANTYSKAVLRVAAQAFADAHENVDYFPSLEIVALSPRRIAYTADCRHVSDDAVRIVIGEFLRLYIGAEIAATSFDELGYLAANPDVAAAARRGEWESGFEHYRARGEAEGRAPR
jgi:hypothetical protein